MIINHRGKTRCWICSISIQPSNRQAGVGLLGGIRLKRTKEEMIVEHSSTDESCAGRMRINSVLIESVGSTIVSTCVNIRPGMRDNPRLKGSRPSVSVTDVGLSGTCRRSICGPIELPHLRQSGSLGRTPTIIQTLWHPCKGNTDVD